MALKAGRVGVRPDQVDSQGKVKKDRPKPKAKDKKGVKK